MSKLSAHLPLPKRFRTGSKQSLFGWVLRALRQRKQTQPGLISSAQSWGLTAPSWVMPVGFLSLLWLKRGAWGCSASPATLCEVLARGTRQGVVTPLWHL